MPKPTHFVCRDVHGEKRNPWLHPVFEGFWRLQVGTLWVNPGLVAQVSFDGEIRPLLTIPPAGSQPIYILGIQHGPGKEKEEA